MHHFLEAEMLAVERDRSINIVDDIANLNRGHSAFLLSSAMTAFVTQRNHTAYNIESPLQPTKKVTASAFSASGRSPTLTT